MEQIYTSPNIINLEETSIRIEVFNSADELSDADTDCKNAFARILLLQQCDGILWIDLNSYRSIANNVFFMKPGQKLRIQDCSVIKGYLLSFCKSYIGMDDESCDSECLAKLLRFFSGELISISDETMAELHGTLHKMVLEQKSDNLYKAELMKRYFKILLIYIIRQSVACLEAGAQHRNMALVEKFMSLLESGFVEKKMVSNYAAELFVSANYLNQIVKKITGNSAGWHIRQRVILEAKRKAVYSDRSMKEIGYMLGFEDPAHFSKLFKKTTGINFVTFRREMVSVPFIREFTTV